MPKKDGAGPPKESKGLRDGRGKGRGFHSNKKGIGKKRGGKQGNC